MFITCGPNGVKLEDFDTFFFFASWRCFPCGAKGEQLRKTDIVRMWINRGRTGGLTYIHVLIVILYFIYIYMIIYVYMF
jgi:hypothetical protein